jgi:amino acid transporter
MPTEPAEPKQAERPRSHRPLAPNLELREIRQGRKAGSRYVRLAPRSERPFEQLEGGYRVTPAAMRPRSPIEATWRSFKRVLVGAPLATSQLIEERLTKVKALAVFSSDNLSSSAYATEEILLVLVAAGTGAFFISIPLSIAISALVIIVATSYTQTVQAYPNGGGAYIVAKDNLGTTPGLVAGASLLVDYVLTVAVSIAAGVAAMTSAVPDLLDFKVELAVGFVMLITIANLRGIRESGTIFAVPAYLFVVSMTALILTGFVRMALGQDLSAGTPPHAIEPGTHAITLFLILRAYSSGSAALTGIEAMSNGVPALKPPEAKNAVITLYWMAGLLTFFFLGLSILAHQLDVVPSETRTVVAQVALGVFGNNIFFYTVQAATAIILVLAANTSFADFPRLSSVMAHDGFMPKQFTFRGDRLGFSNGIIVLGLASALLLIVFNADTHALIPLYAFGVFVGFTLSQTGMVLHWRREREGSVALRILMNGGGALATGVVAVVILVTKFADGAWITVSAIALLVIAFAQVKRHYSHVEERLAVTSPPEELHFPPEAAAKTVIIPIDDINRATVQTVDYARTLSTNITAVHITDEEDACEVLGRRWDALYPTVPLVIIESPWRSFVTPMLAYLDAIEAKDGTPETLVVLPELITNHFWEGPLHNKSSARLKRALAKRHGTVIVEVPFRLDASTPDL